MYQYDCWWHRSYGCSLAGSILYMEIESCHATNFIDIGGTEDILLCRQWLSGFTIFPYTSGLLHCHCNNRTTVPVPMKFSWRIAVNVNSSTNPIWCYHKTTKHNKAVPIFYGIHCFPSPAMQFYYKHTSGPFYWHDSTLIPAWISNCTHHNVWDEITYSFPNFNVATVEVWEWISAFIPHFARHVITNPYWDLS